MNRPRLLPAADRRLLARLLGEMPRGRLLLGAALAVGQAAAIWPTAFLLRFTFDRALPAADPRALGLAGAGVLAASLAQAGFTLGARAVTLDVVKDAVARLRGLLVDELLARPRAFHLRADRGALHAAVVQDTERLDDAGVVFLTQFMPAAVGGLGLLGVLAWLHWPLCLALAALWPVLFLAGRRLRGRLRAGVRAFHAAFERYSQSTGELLRRLDLTRMQGAEAAETALQRERIGTLRRAGRAVAWEGTVHQTGHEIFGVLTGLALLLLGGAAVIQGTLTVGSLVSCFFVARALGHAQNQLVGLVPKLLAGHDALRSLAPLLPLAPDGADDPAFTVPPYAGRKPLPRFDGGIEFRDVTFTYPGTTAPVLRGVCLHLRPGETAALVGPNGAGKSTLIYLLLGFYRPAAGDLRAGGQPYADLDLAGVRARIGVVPQSPTFFRGTVRENLTYGAPANANPPGAAVRRALERAGAAGFVADLPGGLETVIGDDGLRLSGGQRQRLALARALLREPALLVLDEPSTHLDPAAVDTLVNALRAGTPRPAVLLVSHDRALVARCCGAGEPVYELGDGLLHRVHRTAAEAGFSSPAPAVVGALTPATSP